MVFHEVFYGQGRSERIHSKQMTDVPQHYMLLELRHPRGDGDS